MSSSQEIFQEEATQRLNLKQTLLAIIKASLQSLTKKGDSEDFRIIKENIKKKMTRIIRFE